MPGNLKFSLGPLKTFLDRWGNPHKKITAIAVAGTNGKGSTAATLESILRDAGVKTGLYTSPHIFNFRERIKVNNRNISYSEIKTYLKSLRKTESLLNVKLSKFEIITAIAIKYFYDMGCEFCIMETGLGGRLDATNAVSNKPVSVITPVSLEHTQYLGETLEEIAGEKAGIIEERSSIVDFSGTETVGRIARKKGCRLLAAGRDYKVEDINKAGDGKYSFNYSCGDIVINGLVPGLRGKFQCYNTAAAVTAAIEAGFSNPENIKKGLKDVTLPARMEIIELPGGARAVIDSAHNPAAVREILNEVLGLISPGGSIFLIMGVYKDKDYRKMAEILMPGVQKAFLFTPPDKRALEARILAGEFSSKAAVAPDFNEAFNSASKLSGNEDIIMVTGSFSVVRPALEKVL
ncbi:MAG: Mur ligase family protein [Elusimicrobiota bacterium]|nr:Mur ligase family protein [Elusimicrobiota bacterium]